MRSLGSVSLLDGFCFVLVRPGSQRVCFGLAFGLFRFGCARWFGSVLDAWSVSPLIRFGNGVFCFEMDRVPRFILWDGSLGI